MSHKTAKIFIITVFFLAIIALLIYTTAEEKKDTESIVTDIETQLILGHLPMLLHANPEEVLIVGPVSATTAEAVKMYDELKLMDTVENDLRVGPLAGLAWSRKYDVVTAVSSDFTKEQIEFYKKRLKPGGLMVQWVQVNDLSPEAVKTIMATFQENFPHTIAWQNFSGNDIFLIGQETLFKFDFATLQTKIARENVKNDLAQAHLDDPFTLLNYSVLNPEGVQNFSRDTETDTSNYLEALEKHRTNIFTLLEDINDPATQEKLALYALARTYVMQGEIYFTKQLYQEAENAFLKAIALPGQSLFGVYRELARTYIRLGNGDGAIWAYEEIRNIKPDDMPARLELGVLYGKKGLLDKAEQEFVWIIAYDKNNYFAHNNLANVYRLQGRDAEAIFEYQKSLEIMPDQQEINGLLTELISTK